MRLHKQAAYVPSQSFEILLYNNDAVQEINVELQLLFICQFSFQSILWSIAYQNIIFKNAQHNFLDARPFELLVLFNH